MVSLAFLESWDTESGVYTPSFYIFPQFLVWLCCGYIINGTGGKTGWSFLFLMEILLVGLESGGIWVKNGNGIIWFSHLFSLFLSFPQTY
jgi:hypothetical protein